ncbi:MAG: threonine synthase [Ignavibacteria bacterium]|nr:threonine synthase [Ignavibacteria bacterium]
MFTYKCTQCGKDYKRDEVKYLCPVCSKDYKHGMPLKGVLTAEFDYDFIKSKFTKDNPDLDLFSAVEKEFYPEFAHGNTPFVKTSRLSDLTGFNNIRIKNDSLNPSGSYKDRASFLVVAEANRIGESKIVTASTGNAASSLAAVCAAAGKKAMIFVPESAPKAKLLQMFVYGAEVIKVKGTYDDAFKLSMEYTEKNPGLNRNTAYHPLTIEGKKTSGLEMYVQNNFKVPDAVFIPVGDGVIISGVYKAFYDLKMCGLIEKIPKLICVQSEKSNAISNFIETGNYKNADNPATVADSISVSVPSNAYMARNAVISSGGFAITLTDEEIMSAQKELAALTGIYTEPSSSAVLAGLIKSKNKLDTNEQIVLLITGSGLKDTSATAKYLNMNIE